MILSIDPSAISGLDMTEIEALTKLLQTYAWHQTNNIEKATYYEGNIPLSAVNLGLALPKTFKGLEIGCAWGAKTVDVLAARSMFDGFVGQSGNEVPELDQIVAGNQLIAEYPKACRDELKFGATLATLSPDKELGCKIRFHSLLTAAAEWSGEKNRIAYGMAIIDTAPDNNPEPVWMPSLINLYMDDATIALERTGESWKATRYPHKLGRPLMEPLIYNATSMKPLGRSRIKEPIRRLIQGYVRTVANATIGLEFATSPQKYLLGITDDQYEAVINQKFAQYVGNILAATNNPDTGEKPSFGQLSQGSITPHVDMIRLLSTQFSAATGLPVTDTGVVNDSNPSSSDAIEAQTKTLVGLAQDLNLGNGEALRTIALMALAIANDTTIEELSEEQRAVVAHFRNPAMPSVAATADAAIKIASSRQGFAQTDVFLEMLGFDKAEIRRIKAQEQLARGRTVLEELEI